LAIIPEAARRPDESATEGIAALDFGRMIELRFDDLIGAASTKASASEDISIMTRNSQLQEL